MSAPQPAHPRKQIWILIALFFAPLALAFLLYYGGGWRPPGSTNKGELISPPRPLPNASAWHGKWTLVYVGDGRCDERCRAALILTRQTRLALNADMTRVQRVVLVTGNCCDRTYLAAEHPDLRVEPAAGEELLAAFPDAASGAIYIVDPLGNLMMRHAPTAGLSNDLLEDLRKLLKLSHIG
jgi:hypothetical protein